MPAQSSANRFDQSQHSEELARNAVEELFRTHYRGLCACVRDYVHSLDAAEEIVQELFLRVWDHALAGNTQILTRAYLYAAARNQAVSVLRHERVVQDYEVSAIGQSERSGLPTAEEELENEELTIAVRRAVARLPAKCRQVFSLSRERGLTYSEIAEVLGVSVKTVELHMTRALKALRAALPFTAAVLVYSLTTGSSPI